VHYILLTHGAGSNRNAPLLVALANAFSEHNVQVVRYDLPFRQQRPKGPPRPGDAARDREGLRAEIAKLRAKQPDQVCLGGVSYGGRQASMLVADEPELVEGLLLLSYPLHPPGRPAQLRTAHFPKLQTPVLFVSGTRDAFGTEDELRSALKPIPARTKLVSIEGAGHGLLQKSNRAELPGRIVQEFQNFVTA
jgi:uncharacterized protein